MILYDFAQNREHRENRENHENHENIFMIFMIFKTCRGPVLDTKRARPTKSRGPVPTICRGEYIKIYATKDKFAHLKIANVSSMISKSRQKAQRILMTF